MQHRKTCSNTGIFEYFYIISTGVAAIDSVWCGVYLMPLCTKNLSLFQQLVAQHSIRYSDVLPTLLLHLLLLPPPNFV